MTVVIAALAAAAAWLVMAPSAHARLRRVLPAPAPTRQRQLPMPVLASCGLGLGVTVLMSSTWGAMLGIAAGLLAFSLLGRLESRAARDRRLRLARQLPDVCDLLAATLASGAPVHSAITAVATASGAPAAECLMRVVAAMRLGASAADAWQELASEPSFVRVSAAFQRSAVSGAPIAEVLRGVAEDERRRRKSSVEVAARSAGVRTVLPLAACFLPAFILLGIVPVIGSMASGIFAS